MQEITLYNPLDMHLHLREGEMLKNIIDFSVSQFIAAVVMPNLSTPVTTAKLALEYQAEILKNTQDRLFFPLVALYLTESLDQEEFKKCTNNGFKIFKLYPRGVTTNSYSGLDEIFTPSTLEIFEMMEDKGIILCVHGETNGFCLDREYEFGKILVKIAQKFPRLKIILEHMSDHRSIRLLEEYKNIYATLTLHHITMTLDDLLGRGLKPHYFCKPILKTPQDRDALLELALQAHSKVSFGSDSAPHLEKNKLKDNGAAGIFSTPSILCALADLFDKHGCLDNLQAFVSDNAIKNYNLCFKQTKKITLQKKHSWVPAKIRFIQNDIVPFGANQILEWKQI